MPATLKRFQVKKLNWREVFECKRRRVSIEDVFEMALDAGYEYFTFSGEVYQVDCRAIWRPAGLLARDLD